MRRRDFLGIVGSVAAAWPLAARAQQATPVVAVFGVRPPDPSWIIALNKGLASSGFVDGQNVKLEISHVDGKFDLLPEQAAELVRRKATVIVSTGGPGSALAAKSATQTIPIVFITGSDPIKFGLVPSLNRPGGNITGVAFINTTIAAKRLDLLHQLVPAAKEIAYLVNPNNSESRAETNDMQEAARELGIKLLVLPGGTEDDIDQAFLKIGKAGLKALLIASDPVLGGRRAQLATLARHYAIPTITSAREYVALGCLASYGASLPETYSRAGTYVGRILKGESPSDLPVIQPTKFELVLNLKTAKAFGLTVPDKLLALDDEVIE